jgi:hypothetical protein
LKDISDKDLKEIKRLILEKLVLDRRWGMNYIARENIPKGLPREYSTGSYYEGIRQLVKEGFLLPYKKGKCYRLNIALKAQIETLIGKKILPKY